MFVPKPSADALVVAGVMHRFIGEDSYRQIREILQKHKIDESSELWNHIAGFLQEWHSRNTDELAEPIKDVVLNHLQEIENLNSADIMSMSKEEFSNLLDNYVKPIYQSLVNIDGVAMTIASKVLHLLAPELLTMTDMNIRRAYLGSGASNYEKYKEFQLKMYDIAAELKEDFINKVKPAYNILGIDYWTLPRALDAYNWLAITRGVEFEKILNVIAVK